MNNPAKMGGVLPFVVAVAVLLSFPAWSPQAATFTSSTQVDHSSAGVSVAAPAVAVDGNGKIHVLFYYDPGITATKIFASNSTDSGSSFVGDLRVDSTGSGTTNLVAPTLAIGRDNTLYAAWQNGTDIYFAKSSNGGTSWNTEVAVYTGTGTQSSPSMAVEDTGTIFVAWEDTGWGDSTYHISVAKSTNGGTSFGARVEVVPSTTAVQRYPSISVQPGGAVAAVWQENTTNPDIYFSRSTSNGTGGTWSSPALVDTSTTGSQRYPKLAFDTGGKAHVAWEDDGSGNADIFYVNSTDNGTTFTGNKKVSDDAGSALQERPTMAADQNGNLHMAWQDKRSGTYDIYYSDSFDGGSSFSANVRADDAGSGDQTLPTIAVDSGSGSHIAWQDGRGAATKVYFARTLNSPPNAPVLDSPAAGVWVTTNYPTFTWNFSDPNAGDNQSAFQLQADDASSFTVPIGYDGGTILTNATNHTLAADSPLDNGTWYWRVRTRDTAGAWGPWSSARQVKVDTTIPLAAKPSGPGRWSTTTNITWSWAASTDSPSGIAGYYITIGTSSGGSEVVSDAFTPNLTYTLAGAQDGQSYYSRIKAADIAGNAGSYGTEADVVTVDTTPPDAGQPSDAGVYINSSSIKWNWTASADATSGVAGYFISIGTKPGDADVVADAWVGNTTAYTFSSGANGVTYYAKVKAKDVAGNSGAYSSDSDGITVDTSIPVAYVPVDAGAYSNVSALSWSWAASTDNPSGIAGYFVSIGSFPGGDDVVKGNWTTNTTFNMTGGNDGVTYYAKVKARDNAGNTGDWGPNSDGITVDTTPPSDFEASDDGEFTTNSTRLRASWTYSLDTVSGVVEYRYRIKDAAGTVVVDWTSAGLATATARTGLSLAEGTRYIMEVRARNGAGLWSNTTATDGITVDTAAPVSTAPSVRGPWTNTTSVIFSWNGSADAVSGVAGYLVYVGTSAGAADVINGTWTTAMTLTYPSGTNGVTYYAFIRAVDRAGNTGAASPSSPGTTVDISVPVSYAPTDEGAYTYLTELTFRWSPSPDYPSGIEAYYISIGTTPGGDDVLSDLRTAGTNYTLAVPEGALNGLTYYAKVRAVDWAGNAGTYGPNSDGITVDITPPEQFQLSAQPFVNLSRTMRVSWTPSADAESGIAGYYYALGTTPGGEDLIPWTGTGTVASITYINATLFSSDGKVFFLTVKAHNGAGDEARVSANITVDLSPPGAAEPAAAGNWSNSSTVVWTWKAAADASNGTASGIGAYIIGIGTAPGAGDVVSGIVLTPSTLSYGYPFGRNGVTYYVSLRAVDRAGNEGALVAPSRGVTVDTTLPAAYSPLDSGAYATATTLSWNWTSSSDAPSGVAGYYISIGTAPGAEDVIGDRWVTGTSFTLEGGKDGTTYYAKVKARDNAGNTGPSSPNSDGITVDLTPPKVSVRLNNGANFTNSPLVTLAIAPDAADAAEMRVWEGSTEPAVWEPFAPSRAWTLQPGDSLKRISVRLRDRAGNPGETVIATITLDTAPPALPPAGEVRVQGGEYTFAGKVDPGTALYINGEAVPVTADGSYSHRVKLGEGTNLFTFTTVDPAGNTAVVTRTVSREAGLLSTSGGGGSLLLLLMVLTFGLFFTNVGLFMHLRGSIKGMTPQAGVAADLLPPPKEKKDKARPPEKRGRAVEDEEGGKEEEGEKPKPPLREGKAGKEEKVGKEEEEDTVPMEEVVEEKPAPEALPQAAPPPEPKLLETPVLPPPPAVGPAPVISVPALEPVSVPPAVPVSAAAPAAVPEPQPPAPEPQPAAPEDALPAEPPRMPARHLYAALLGKPEAAVADAPQPPSADAKPVSKVRCVQCRAVVPVYTAERPVRIVCPSCGKTGVLRR